MPAIAYSVLPAVITEFSAKHPGIHVLLNILNSESVFDWLGAHQMDIGIAALTSQRTVAEIELIPCPPCMCVLRSDSPLAKNDTITPQDLEDQPFISTFASSMLRRQVDEVFQAAGISRKMVMETTYSSSAIQLVKCGLGVTIVDPFTAHTLTDTALAVRPFHPTIPYEFGLLFPKSATLSLAAQSFLDVLRSSIDEVNKAGPAITSQTGKSA